jgi:GMP synthase-like glutamine amidotransferase
MPVVVFQHNPSCSIGLLGDLLNAHKIEWQYAGTDSPGPENAQAVVSLGGPMSVNDPSVELREEQRYIVRAISSGVPVLGICLGAQLVAKCLGSEVRPMGRKEIGWHAVRFTERGAGNPLFAGLCREETIFQWHGETFDLPAGAEWLAESSLCRNQAFRWGSNVYGFQFHPEVTPEIIRSWCEEDSRCGDLREAEGPIDACAHQESTARIAGQIFGSWCKSLT